MQPKHGKAILLTLGLAVSPAVAQGAEKTLEFRLVSKALDPQTLEAPNIENQTIMQSKGFGVAVFKDGRVGTKDYIFTRDANKGVGTLVGYSTYYFDEGSVTARFTATIGGPQGTHGDYKISGGDRCLCRSHWNRHLRQRPQSIQERESVQGQASDHHTLIL